MSGNQSFRNPNVDEFLFATDDLQAQEGIGFDAGLRLTPDPRLEISATAFTLNVEDEIFFSEDSTGRALNRNLDQRTKRRGGELEVRALLHPDVGLHASLGYVRPRIEDLDADIPLVPRITANIGAEWTIRPWAEIAVSATHVGTRFDGNDITNDLYPKLPAYTTCDARLRLTRGKIEFFAGINNIFNEIYSTIAYSATVYPMPERNAYAGLRIDFF
ncbi:MAG: TonB-dependent receptor domain-containing protein [Gammaproteobacteria bacterium]